MVENTIDALLDKGFSKRMGQEYLNVLATEDKSDLFEPEFRAWAHSLGFSAESASAYQLTETNRDDYLSDYDYARVWPLNSWERIWINDKLTLKYVLNGTEWGKYLPEYYFYASPSGLAPLTDVSCDGSMDSFLGVLREKGEFACKPCNGERAAGFHKLGYRDGTYLVDNLEATEADVMRYVEEHPNDLYTEFFHPGGGLEKISPVVHTLRILTVNPTAVDPHLAASYFRFATGVNGDDSKANYRPPEQRGVCSYNVRFDMESGTFGDGKLVYGNHIVSSNVHPDTGVRGEGRVESWQEIRDMCLGIADYLDLVEYMGFDVSVTPEGPRLIEINSHSGCKYLQVFRPFMADEYLHDYFAGKLAAIDTLDDAGRARRNAICR